MEWFTSVITWYLYLLFIGIVFAPFAKKLFGSFFDFGYPFAKTIGIIILSYTIFVLGIIKIIPFTRESLFFIAILYLLFFYRKIIKLNWEDIKKLPKSLFLMIGIEEVLFFISLVFLAYVRGHEPSIHGLEKFMDFGFMNSILRSTYFPPLDMWYGADPTSPAGYPINYYYFGHLTGSMLIKLSNITPTVGYNLVLATIFAQGVTLTFSLCAQLIHYFQKYVVKMATPNVFHMILFGLLGAFIVNLGGNLHPIYILTQGYPNENPIPFWEIFQNYSDVIKTMSASADITTQKTFIDALIENSKYWYPNATRFIPFTIHEFPSYSYVVADLHGHVFDIPFVLVTLALITQFFISITTNKVTKIHHIDKKNKHTKEHNTKIFFPRMKNTLLRVIINNLFTLNSITTIILGFMLSIHYMTNAFDGPIYLLLLGGIFLVIYQLRPIFFIQITLLVLSFIIFSYPFSSNFAPFASGIGVNCSPGFLTALKNIGPFMFIEGNCQISQVWMLFILWGFFWLAAILYLIALFFPKNEEGKRFSPQVFNIDVIMLMFFAFGTFLVIIPEFFYIKDIYPQHFRANTMFKMGYQAFIIMGIASTFALYRIKMLENRFKFLLKAIYFFFFIFVAIYPFLAFPSYYPLLQNGSSMQKNVHLDGIKWMEMNTIVSQDKEIIEYINSNIVGQPIILEAQGDSYTDYERISANTGIPTIAGWWVHEWLWRGDANVVGNRIPEIEAIYQSPDLQVTKALLKKYNVSYVVISQLERDKYKTLNEEKFKQLGSKIFTTNNGFGALYKIN